MVEEPEPVFSPDERFSLRGDSPIPLYYQIEQIILDRISQEETIGRRLPSETELVEIFNVSRATVKKTMENLVNKGLLERRRGIGTTVIKHQIIENLARLTSYTEEMKQKGLTIRTRVLEHEIHLPSPDVRRKLDLGETDQTLSISRLRGTNEVFPIVLLHSEIPMSFGIRQDEDFSGSLYHILESKYGIPILWGEETIEAANASLEEAELLQIKSGSTVLIIERVAFTHGNKPVEYVKGIYRPDHYKFSIKLNR